MTRSKRRLTATVSGAAVLIIFLLVPIVPYIASVSIPRNYGDNALGICQSLVSNATEYSGCISKNALAPVPIVGRSALAYSMLGFGPGPYPPVTLITQGNESALVYMQGSAVAMAELLPFDSEVGPFPKGWIPLLLPEGSVRLSDVGFTPDANGLLDFSATVSGLPSVNYSGQSFIPAPKVYFDYPGYGINLTAGGVVWHSPVADIACGGSAGYCVASRIVAANANLQAKMAYPMTVVVYGYQADGVQNFTETSSNGQKLSYSLPRLHAYVYVQTLDVEYPGSGVNSAWVLAFMDVVNSARYSSPLVEDAGLDAFALTRFNTASGNYQISDYGFDSQSTAYFAGTGKTSTEEILFPSTFSPSDFAAYLRQQAPGHWAGLLEGVYTKFGYHIGTAPYVELGLNCQVTEITQRNVNITQLAIQNGCKYATVTTTWIIIVLSD